MRTKFFLKDHHRLRLEAIVPKESKPKNRIHLKFSMPLAKENHNGKLECLDDAPTQIRRGFEYVSDQSLDMPDIPISTKIKGVDVEIFATPPTSQKVPVQVVLTSCILRDIRIHRLTKGEIRLFFSIGISWDKKVWAWGGAQFSYECFAQFHESQSTLLDDSVADESLSTPAEPQAADGKSMAANDPLLAMDTPGDPRVSEAFGNTRRRTDGGKGKPLPFHRKGKNSEARA